MYEKFQVNSTYGLAGRAFRSLQLCYSAPIRRIGITFLEQHLDILYTQCSKFRVAVSFWPFGVRTLINIDASGNPRVLALSPQTSHPDPHPPAVNDIGHSKLCTTHSHDKPQISSNWVFSYMLMAFIAPPIG